MRLGTCLSYQQQQQHQIRVDLHRSVGQRLAVRGPSRRRPATTPLTAPVRAAAFAFTPMESGVAGLSLGVLAFSRMLLTGRVLGISGIVKGALEGSWEAWRVAFTTGLLAGGVALTSLLPTAFEALPATYTWGRAIGAGLLVGYGTAMGNGCTSGHGICGNSRLSKRSIAATLLFMTSGALAAALTNTAGVFGLPPGIAPLTPPGHALKVATGLLAVSCLAQLGLARLARRLVASASSANLKAEGQLKAAATAVEDTPLASAQPAALGQKGGQQCACPEDLASEDLASVAVVSDLASGALFALGLGCSGMLRPSKVAGFLSVLSGVFDPSLMFVMGGALAVSLPATLYGLKCLKRPLAGSSFCLPKTQHVDRNLVLGALLFGAGWGIGGICPGPGLVSLATLQPKVWGFVLSMLAGMRLFSATSATWA